MGHDPTGPQARPIERVTRSRAGGDDGPHRARHGDAGAHRAAAGRATEV